MSESSPPRVLCVDDEAQVLSDLERSLRKSFWCARPCGRRRPRR